MNASSKQGFILIVDDDPAVCKSLSLLVGQAGYSADVTFNPAETLKAISGRIPDLIIMDMNFSRETSGEEGLELLNQIRSSYQQIPVILITAWGSIDLAVRGMQAGAVDFINKPWDNDHLLQSVATALNLSRVTGKRIRSRTRQQLAGHHDFEKIIGEDPRMLEVLDTTARVCATDASVLILGESGTGKELVAEAIHMNSHRRDAPFVKVNLGGMVTSLFESEMFGHRRGAFTGATHDRKGRFEKAHTGTIFLDEVGDLDPSCQVKMMRVLQDRTFEVLGSSETRQVDVRVIAATNRDLQVMVADGAFREDLFYRLNLISIQLPALRERRGDIPRLVYHFLGNLATIYGYDELSVDSAAMRWLQELPWSGNIRELKNIVERTVLLSGKRHLEKKDFAVHLNAPIPHTGGQQLPGVGTMTLEEMERSMIQQALRHHDGNISQVARSLGLSRAALYRRLEKYELS